MDSVPSNDVSSAFSSPTFEKDGSFDVDKPVGSMSISPCGRDVVLASRQGLHIIDLDSPYAPPRHLPHLTPWEVADVQWSPFSSRDYWVVSTSNQKALVWNLALATPQGSIEHILHAHNRAITDINFSAHHPDVLSTCAIDGFVHCWDLRHTARPAITFCDWFAGATQVKWSRQEPHVIASSHDKTLRIWDERNGSKPIRSIEAHGTKIYGIDWNRTRSHGIVTCSLDRTIKFWDTSQEDDEPERVIHTPFPVWRARHTPFGWGLLAMPQRGDNDVYLYDRRLQNDSEKDAEVAPMKRFEGHENQVKEFLWRPRGGIDDGIDNREFQLVTWGNDKTLRLHHLEDSDLADVGHRRGAQVHHKLTFTRLNAQYRTFREDPAKSYKPNSKGLSAANKSYVDTDSGMAMHRTVVRTSIRSPATSDSGWMGGGFVNSHQGFRGKNGGRKDLDPISWMKGVKIGKREVLLEQSGTSTASPNFRAERSIEEFDSLGEEITHVGSKFSKVEFLQIDVQSRYLKFSLYGPWGQKHNMTYLECRLNFPKDYPVRAGPVLNIEKTASVDKPTASQLQEDVKAIADAFKVVQRSSLETIVHYLQGDQSLDEALSWTKEDQDTSVYDFAEGSSSGESDAGDEEMEYPGNQNGDFMTGSGVLSASNANVNVPLPKTCGAIWCSDGRLVCFFPPKEEKTTSLAGSLGLEGPAALLRKRRRLFEGFGKVHKVSATARSKASSIGTIDSEDTGSDYETDSSDFSSSGSSASSKDTSFKARAFAPQHAFRTDMFNFPRAVKTTDEAERSVASGSAVNRIQENQKTAISIIDLGELLPSQRSLAKEYVLTGVGACLHNSRVAQASGLHDLADVWMMLEIILKAQVPIQAVSVNKDHSPPVDVRVLKPLQRRDSGVDLSIDMETGSESSASVKWGKHPLGQEYLIKELFLHFAQIVDVQMLAMMSCMLAIPETEQIAIIGEFKHDEVSVQSPLSLHGTLLSPTGMTPRTDYFPSIEVAISVLEADKPLLATTTDESRSRIEPPSMASSFGASNSDPTAPMSAGLTPPMNFKSMRRSFEATESYSQNISGSPERSRWTQRSASNITGALASSFPRPFSFSASASSSPPHLHAKKRTSPISSLGVSQTQGTGWASNGFVSRSMSTTEDTRQAKTFAERARRRQHQGALSEKSVGVSTRLRNQDQFLNDGYSNVPFLDEHDDTYYSTYRSAYADMLSVWGLYFTRTEILKYNRHGTAKQAQSHLLIGRKTQSSTSLASDTQKLHLNAICSDCGEPQAWQGPLEKVKCSLCSARWRGQTCDFCNELARGRIQPCLACGHILHSHCRRLLVLNTMSETSSQGCVTGCDCLCASQVDVKLQWPSDMHQEPHSPAPSTIREVEEKNLGHTDEAWASLAKNLGAGPSKQRFIPHSRHT